MKIVKTREGIFIKGGVDCAVCGNPVLFQLNLDIIHFHLTHPMMCSECDPFLNKVKDIYIQEADK